MPKVAQPEKKELVLLEVKMTEGDGNGRLEGYASVKGNVDSYGDVILDGAYKNLDVLKTKGWSGFNHSSEPVGMIVDAHEDAKGLFVAVEFHSTQYAQDVRKVAQERAAKGMQLGMSIMYRTIESGYVTRDGDEIRELKAIEVIEAGFVMLPANQAATVTSVKGSSGATSLGEDFEAARELVEKAIGRVMDLKESASGDLTAGRIALVDDLYQKVGEWREAIQKKTADDQPEMATEEDVNEVRALLAASGVIQETE